MSQFKKSLILFFAFKTLLGCDHIHAQTVPEVYYVSTNGSLSNTGLSADSPWPLAYAVTKLGPGITLTLMPGVYSGPVIVYGVNGTAQNPMTIRSQIKWKAIIANSARHGIALGFTPFVNYLVIDGLCVTNSAADGIGLAGQNCTVRNCWVTGNYRQGINAGHSAGSNNVVEYNLVENNGKIAEGTSDFHYHGMYISGPNNIVRGNVVRNNNNGFGIHFYTEDAGVRQNNNYIYNNLIYGHTNAYGVTMWNAVDGGALPGTNYLFNNTILDGVSLCYGATEVTNNIILSRQLKPSPPIYSPRSRRSAIRSDYNFGTNTISPAGAIVTITFTGDLTNNTAFK